MSSSSDEKNRRADAIQQNMDRLNDVFAGSGSLVLAGITAGLIVALIWWWARAIF